MNRDRLHIDSAFIAASDRMRLQGIEALLASLSYKTEVFENEVALMEAAKTWQPRFLLIDCDFENTQGNGFQVSYDFSNIYPETIIVALTVGPTDMLNRVRAAKAGAVGLLPFDTTASELYTFLDDEYAFLHAPIKVLVVDDSPTDGLGVRRQLTKSGFKAEHIVSPYDLLEACERLQPDIIITDYWMPECTGSDLVKALRMDRRFASLPIIYLSSETNENRQLDAMARGGDEFLTKPVNPGYMARTIENRVLRARKMRLLSERDSMSGLLNHATCLDILRKEIDLANDHGHELTMAILDLDHFKHVNDTHGHQVGDQVIRSFAAFIKRSLGPDIHIGRHGGEEFLVLFPKTPMQEAYASLNRMRMQFSQLPHRNHEGTSFYVTFSAGLATLEAGNTDLIYFADNALYDAKRSGRNTIKWANTSIPTPSAI